MNLSNSSYANETSKPWKTRSLDHTKITLYSILLVWSLLGNVLVIVVVYCNQILRTNMNYLIVNMAASDLLVPLAAVPWRISFETLRPLEWLVEGPLGEALCKLVPFLSDISPYVSSISLVIITIQRFIAIVYPTRMHILTSKTRWILISIPWIVAMALLTPLLYTSRLEKHWAYTICYHSWSPAFDFWPSQMIFISIVYTVGYFIPLITIITLYAVIQYKLRKSLNNVTALIERERLCLRQKRNRRILNMSIAIILVFTVCWSPLAVLNLLHAKFRYSLVTIVGDEALLKLFFAFGYLWYLQAAINPCIYFVFLRDFRVGFKSLCRRKTASVNRHLPTILLCSARTAAQGGNSNQDATCTRRHINTTSV